MSREPLLVTAREAAGVLGVGRDACYSLIRAGRLRAVRIGRRIYVPRAELVAFIARELEAASRPLPEGPDA